MEVISKVQDNCEKEFKDWIKKIFNIEDEEIKSVIIYSNNEKIYEISCKDSE